MSKEITIKMSEETYHSLKEQIEEREGKIKEKSKKKFQIKSTLTGDILYESEKTTCRDALQEAVGRGVNLRGVNLRGVNLRGVNLRDANLIDANLIGANLRDANLTDANLRDADLRGADLRDAELMHAKFYGKGGTTKIKKNQVDDFFKALGVIVED